MRSIMRPVAFWTLRGIAYVVLCAAVVRWHGFAMVMAGFGVFKLIDDIRELARRE